MLKKKNKSQKTTSESPTIQFMEINLIGTDENY